MTAIKRLAEERRRRKGSVTPAARAGHEWGVVTGVYETRRGRARLVARVLLTGGLAVTAYLPSTLAVPAVHDTVQVSVVSSPDCCGIRAFVADQQ